MTDTPIKRGTARRLGLDRPVAPEPFSWDRFGTAMADIERRMTETLRTGFLFPPMMGRPSGVQPE